MTTVTEWPDGKRFAFTVFDDTDNLTLDQGAVVYRFLADLGLRTTKSVWPIEAAAPAAIGGTSCENLAYRSWAQQLQQDGFEIGLHGVAAGTADRTETIRGLDAFRRMFGDDPATHANHAGCRNNIYWGAKRVSGAQRLAYQLMTPRRGRRWEGDEEASPLFWGDLCRDRVTYVRNFVLGDINTLAACPWMPYHDPDRPYVNMWFASAEGADVESFVAMLSEKNQDRLEEEGGACIVYTHFASGFVDGGKLHPRFRGLMERLAAKPGWFVPTATLLDHLRAGQAPDERVIPRRARGRLERAWLRHKVRIGGTS